MEKTIKNGFAATIQKGVRISEQLLLIPFFISAWGAPYYGEWLTLTVIPTIIGFSDLGFGTAAANLFVLKYASGDKQGASNIATSGLLSISIIIVLSLLLSVALISTCAYFDLFDKLHIAKNQAIVAVFLLITARVLSFYQQLFEAYFRAVRRVALSINLQTGYSVAILVASVIVLLNGGGIVLFALSNLVITLVFVSVYALVANKILPVRNNHRGVVLKSDIKDIAKSGFGFLLLPVWQAVFFQGTTFVVRVVLGPEAVAIFNTVRTVTRAINQTYTIVITAILPEFQFEIGKGNLEKARALFRISLTLVVAIAVAGVLVLSFGGSWLYEVWTHKALNPPAMMWNIFIAGIIFNAVWWTASFVFQAMNKPYDFAVSGVVCALFSVIASYFFALFWGLNGVAIGSFLMDIALFVYLLPRSCKLIGQPLESLIPDCVSDVKVLWRKRGSMFE